MFKIPFLNSREREKINNTSKYKLVVGLGNPGGKYEETYHNVGEMYLNHLSKINNLTLKKYKSFEYAKTPDVILIKPSIYMNQSGLPVKKALKYFNVNPKDILIVHDDSDIALGEYKISFGKNDGGHNGIKSVINHLKTTEFNRLRIGVRKHGGRAGEFILKKMSAQDLEVFRNLFVKLETIYREGNAK